MWFILVVRCTLGKSLKKYNILKCNSNLLILKSDLKFSPFRDKEKNQ